MTVHTIDSLTKQRCRLDRLQRLHLRVEEVVADMAAGLALYRGLDRWKHVQWTLSDGEVIKDEVARLVIKQSCIAGVGDCLFPEIGELSQPSGTSREVSERIRKAWRSCVRRQVATAARS